MEKIFQKILNGNFVTGIEQRILFDNVTEYEVNYDFDYNNGRCLTIVYEVIYKIKGRYFRTYYNWNGNSILFDGGILEEVRPRERTIIDWVGIDSNTSNLEER